MHILFLILKILGILLLSILGIFILLILLILFVPIRYQVEGNIKDGFQVEIGGRIRWLLSLLYLRFSYLKGEFSYQIRIFGIKLKKKEKTELELEEYEESEEDMEPESDSEPEEDRKPEDGIGQEKEASSLKKESNQESQNTKDISNTGEDIPGRRNPFEQMKKFIFHVKEKVLQFFRFLKEIKTKIIVIKEQLTDETNKRVAGLIWKEVKYLVSHLKFRRIDTDFTFSAGDPALTGQALGILSLFPMLYQYRFGICPDFESEELYLKGSFKIAGRVQIFPVVVSGIRLIKEKDVRDFIKNIINHDERKGE